jgi:outer membrane lipoprotein-sorting protein
MSSLKYALIILSICAMVLGCATKRMPEEKGEGVSLSQVLPVIATKYQGVRSLQAQVTAKLEVQQELYLMHGIILYENPSSLRLQLAMSLGPTAGEVIYTDGLLMILVPSEGTLYRGRLQETRDGEEAVLLTVSFQDFQDTEHGSVPLRIYGETRDGGLRFELRLKDIKVNTPLPAGAFAPRTGGWEVHPLADLKELLYASRGETRP